MFNWVTSYHREQLGIVRTLFSVCNMEVSMFDDHFVKTLAQENDSVVLLVGFLVFSQIGGRKVFFITQMPPYLIRLNQINMDYDSIIPQN